MGTGNTHKVTYDDVMDSVHPRGHGEHLLLEKKMRKLIGSSPWARGTHPNFSDLIPSRRFIPVGTGNTAAPDALALT